MRPGITNTSLDSQLPTNQDCRPRPTQARAHRHSRGDRLFPRLKSPSCITSVSMWLAIPPRFRMMAIHLEIELLRPSAVSCSTNWPRFHLQRRWIHRYVAFNYSALKGRACSYRSRKTSMPRKALAPRSAMFRAAFTSAWGNDPVVGGLLNKMAV